MTLVVAWHDATMNALRFASDSRISSGQGAITDFGAKLLEVRVRCAYTGDEKGLRPLHAYSFAFGYAGSTLTALSTHSLTSAITSSLFTANECAKPMSLHAVTELFAAVMRQVFSEIGMRVTNVIPYFFTSLIGGFCPVRQEYQVFVVKPSLVGGVFSIDIELLPLIGSLSVAAIGSGTNEYYRILQELADTGILSPLRALKNLIDGEFIDDVGGHIQAACVLGTEYHPMPVIYGEVGPIENASILGWFPDRNYFGDYSFGRYGSAYDQI